MQTVYIYAARPMRCMRMPMACTARTQKNVRGNLSYNAQTDTQTESWAAIHTKPTPDFPRARCLFEVLRQENPVGVRDCTKPGVLCLYTTHGVLIISFSWFLRCFAWLSFTSCFFCININNNCSALFLFLFSNAFTFRFIHNHFYILILRF